MNDNLDWPVAPLGKQLNLKRGHDLPTRLRIEGSIPIYSSSGLSGRHAVAKCEPPGVITGRYGTIGNVFFASEPYWPLNTTLYVEDFKSNDPKFVYYFLKTFDWKAYSDKSAVPGVNRNHVHEELVAFPPVADQRAIASVLTSLDDKIDLLHRQNKTLEAMAETLFRQWFVEEASDKIEITHYVDFNPTRTLRRGTPAPYLDMAGVSTTTFSSSGWYDREFSSGTKFINGDTLLARITPCLENGKSAYVTFLEPEQVGWGSTEFIIMRSRNPLSPFFTYALARNQEFREYAEGCMAGSSGRQRVDVNHLKQFEIGHIPDAAILEFNEIVDTIPPRLHLNMLQIRTLEKLRDTLLPKLVSGEVRVQYE